MGGANECGTSPENSKFKNIYKTQQEEKGHATHLIIKNIMSVTWVGPMNVALPQSITNLQIFTRHNKRRKDMPHT